MVEMTAKKNAVREDKMEGKNLTCAEGEDVEEDITIPEVYVKGDKSTQLYRISKTWLLFLSWVCLVSRPNYFYVLYFILLYTSAISLLIAR